MMEAHEQEGYARNIKSIIMLNTAKSVHDVQIDSERSDFTLATTTEPSSRTEHKQNFNFGGEIVTVRQQYHHQQQLLEQQEHDNREAARTTSVTKGAASEKAEMKVNVETTVEPSEMAINHAAEVSSQTAGGDAECSVEVNELNEDDDDEVDDEDEDEDEDDDDDEDDDELDTGNASSQPGRGLADMDDESDDSASDSDFSDISGMSDISGREWKPISAHPINWVQKQILSGANPRKLLSQMLPTSGNQLASGLNDVTLWRLLASLISEPPRRQKLRHVNTFEDVIQLIQRSQNIIVLTGAGVSVSCGIPDFRSSDGIYSRLAKDYPDLPDPQAMFDIGYFSRDPRPFFKFAREIYPGQFKPSPCHRFIKLLEEKQKLLRNYTQNIDTLEQVAGIRNVIECHGSFSSASCTKCRYKCDADAIRTDIFAQRIPVCPRCQPNVQQSVDASQQVSERELAQLVQNGIMKPDIVFFDEGLPQEFHTVMASDKDKCDLLIVMGSSLKVRPVALIPSSIPADVPQILINREQLHHLEFDVELLGDSDVIINQLCHCLGDDWKQICFNNVVLKEVNELQPLNDTTEGEEDPPSTLDTDTQSVKSNASTDIALRSAGAYSDSGFESSTSSGVAAKIIGNSSHPHHHNHNHNHNIHTQKTIEQLKHEMLQPLTKTKTAELLPPHLLDGPMEEAVDFGHPDFRGFTTRLSEHSVTTGACNETYRHLSIDSTKDSGIQCCDSSNSALPASINSGALMPPVTSFSDTGGTDESIHNTKSITSNLPADQEGCDADSKMHSVPSNAPRELKRRRQQKWQSAAERLIEGTYYWHESTSSYVFPGAQVSWCIDPDDDMENDNGGDMNNLNDEDDCEQYRDANDEDGNVDHAAPLSPLLSPSVEEEMVNEITTTANVFSSASITAATLCTSTSHYTNNTSGNCSSVSSVGAVSAVSLKRHSTETIETDEDDTGEVDIEPEAALNVNSNSNIATTITYLSNKDDSTPTLLCSPPPLKRRRDSTESPNNTKCSINTQTTNGNSIISSAEENFAMFLTGGSLGAAATSLSAMCNKNLAINTSTTILSTSSAMALSLSAPALDSTATTSNTSSNINNNRSNSSRDS